MKNYDSMIIAKSDSTEDDIQSIIDKVTAIVETNNGKVTNVDKIGKRKLAYEIKKNKEGYYICIEFSVDASAIAEIEKYYRISEDIIKQIIIRKDEN